MTVVMRMPGDGHCYHKKLQSYQIMRPLVLLCLFIPSACAQVPSPLQWDNCKLMVDVRSREVARTGVTFGLEPDLENPLFRTRIGAQWTPKCCRTSSTSRYSAIACGGCTTRFSELIPKGVVDIYVLRRDQNRPGGFAAAGSLGLNTFGGRAAGPALFGLRWRQLALRRPLDVSVEYKYASNHDKFGHADLFGWRNIHKMRSLDICDLHLERAPVWRHRRFGPHQCRSRNRSYWGFADCPHRLKPQTSERVGVAGSAPPSFPR